MHNKKTSSTLTSPAEVPATQAASIDSSTTTNANQPTPNTPDQSTAPPESLSPHDCIDVEIVQGLFYPRFYKYMLHCLNNLPDLAFVQENYSMHFLTDDEFSPHRLENYEQIESYFGPNVEVEIVDSGELYTDAISINIISLAEFLKNPPADIEQHIPRWGVLVEALGFAEAIKASDWSKQYYEQQVRLKILELEQQKYELESRLADVYSMMKSLDYQF